MAFLGPALGLAGSLFGGMMGGKMPQAQKDALNAQASLMRTQQGALQQGINTATNTVIPTGQNWMDMASTAINPAANYWSSILSGDRNTMTQALSPEITQLTSGNTAAINNANQFMPRGGARSQTLANVPFTQAQQIGNLFATLRPQAATALGQLGTTEGSIGSGLLSSGLFGLTGAGGGAGATGASLIGGTQNATNAAFGRGSAIGGGITNLASSLPWSTWFPPKSTASPSGGGGGAGWGF